MEHFSSSDMQQKITPHLDLLTKWLNADDLPWLEPNVLSSLESLLPNKMWQWLSISMADAEPQKWTPFKLNANAAPAAELKRWQKHARFPFNMSLPDCIGVRAVQDLQHVSPEVQLTVMRPVQQARLRWALRSYQEQLAAAMPAPAPDEDARHNAREQARVEVAAAYNTYRGNHDVRGVMEHMRAISSNNMLNATRLLPPLAFGASGWKKRMLRIIKQAYCMAHPDKHNQASIMQYAYACEVFLKLKEWERAVKLRYPSL